jgi:hypothetical protein
MSLIAVMAAATGDYLRLSSQCSKMALIMQIKGEEARTCHNERGRR